MTGGVARNRGPLVCLRRLARTRGAAGRYSNTRAWPIKSLIMQEFTITRVRKVPIDAEHAGQRIDNFLRRELPGVPKGRLYRLLRRGEVRVNGGRIRADYKLEAGDEVRIPPVRVSTGGPPPPAKLSSDIVDHVLFEDKKLLVIDKPTGVAVHGGSGVSHGVVELLRHARPELKDLSLVHRLDRETSGCLVLAKRRSALRSLHEKFREGIVEKNYLALAVGDWQHGEQMIDAPLLVTHRKGGERHVIVDETGKSRADPHSSVASLRRLQPGAMFAADRPHASDPGARGCSRAPAGRGRSLRRCCGEQARRQTRIVEAVSCMRSRLRFPMTAAMSCTSRRRWRTTSSAS